MKRQTIASVVAALALGFAMSAVFGESEAHQTGQTPPGQNTPEQIRRCEEQYAACLESEGCGPNSTAEERTACERACVNDSPALCLQYRQSPRGQRFRAPLGAVLTRP
jgi:hypothetical protein